MPGRLGDAVEQGPRRLCPDLRCRGLLRRSEGPVGVTGGQGARPGSEGAGMLFLYSQADRSLPLKAGLKGV